MSLSLHEQKAIAALSTDPAYQLLVDKIGKLVDDLMDQLYVQRDPAVIQRYFPYWQALRTCYIELKTTPENFIMELNQDERDVLTQSTQNVTNERIRELLKTRGSMPPSIPTPRPDNIPYHNIL